MRQVKTAVVVRADFSEVEGHVGWAMCRYMRAIVMFWVMHSKRTKCAAHNPRGVTPGRHVQMNAGYIHILVAVRCWAALSLCLGYNLCELNDNGFPFLAWWIFIDNYIAFRAESMGAN